jgi:hypothetical protein
MSDDSFQERTEEVGRWKMHIRSYQVDGKFVCTVDNVDPGANVSRATAATREEAEAEAVGKARERIASTKVSED